MPTTFNLYPPGQGPIRKEYLVEKRLPTSATTAKDLTLKGIQGLVRGLYGFPALTTAMSGLDDHKKELNGWRNLGTVIKNDLASRIGENTALETQETDVAEETKNAVLCAVNTCLQDPEGIINREAFIDESVRDATQKEIDSDFRTAFSQAIEAARLAQWHQTATSFDIEQRSVEETYALTKRFFAEIKSMYNNKKPETILSFAARHQFPTFMSGICSERNDRLYEYYESETGTDLKTLSLEDRKKALSEKSGHEAYLKSMSSAVQSAVKDKFLLSTILNDKTHDEILQEHLDGLTTKFAYRHVATEDDGTRKLETLQNGENDQGDGNDGCMIISLEV